MVTSTAISEIVQFWYFDVITIGIQNRKTQIWPQQQINDTKLKIQEFILEVPEHHQLILINCILIQYSDTDL